MKADLERISREARGPVPTECRLITYMYLQTKDWQCGDKTILLATSSKTWISLGADVLQVLFAERRCHFYVQISPSTKFSSPEKSASDAFMSKLSSALVAAEAAAATTFARMNFSTPARLGGLTFPFSSLSFSLLGAQLIFPAISFLFLWN